MFPSSLFPPPRKKLTHMYDTAGIGSSAACVIRSIPIESELQYPPMIAVTRLATKSRPIVSPLSSEHPDTRVRPSIDSTSPPPRYRASLSCNVCMCVCVSEGLHIQDQGRVRCIPRKSFAQTFFPV